MTRYWATYDLSTAAGRSSPHSEFLKQAEKVGWSSWILINGVWNKAPNTTVVGEFLNRDKAREALSAAVAATSRELGWTVGMPKMVIFSGGGLVRSDVTKSAR
jgi:hypothetical protein